MLMSLLNASQRRQFAEIIEGSGFAIDEFQLRPSRAGTSMRQEGEAFLLEGTEYYLSVYMNITRWTADDQFYLEMSPGPESLHVRATAYNWQSVCQYFVEYLQLLRQELGTVDPWNSAGVRRVAKKQGNQTLIPAGNEFAGQRLARLVFAEATKTLDILDPYVGPELLDRINDADVKVPLRVLTGTKSKPSTSYFAAFKKTYPNAELRVLEENKLHDRFIIVDGSNAYHVGHSIKDLGKKDTNVSRVENVDELKKLFGQRWAEAKPI
jgi:hypothetical protein